MKRKEGRGFWAKFPSFFLLPLPGTEEAQGGRPWGPAALGAREAGEWGKTERRPRGSDSPAHLERRQPMESGRRWPAGGSDYSGGGGAGRLGRGRAAAGEVTGVESCARGLFIGEERWWSAVEAGR